MPGRSHAWEDPPAPPEDEAADLSMEATAEVESRAVEVLRRHEAELLERPAVRGVGVGSNELGEPAIVVYLAHAVHAADLPQALEGVQVVSEVVGEIDAY